MNYKKLARYLSEGDIEIIPDLLQVLKREGLLPKPTGVRQLIKLSVESIQKRDIFVWPNGVGKVEEIYHAPTQSFVLVSWIEGDPYLPSFPIHSSLKFPPNLRKWVEEETGLFLGENGVLLEKKSEDTNE